MRPASAHLALLTEVCGVLRLLRRRIRGRSSNRRGEPDEAVRAVTVLPARRRHHHPRQAELWLRPIRYGGLAGTCSPSSARQVCRPLLRIRSPGSCQGLRWNMPPKPAAQEARGDLGFEANCSRRPTSCTRASSCPPASTSCWEHPPRERRGCPHWIVEPTARWIKLALHGLTAAPEAASTRRR